MPKFAEVGSMQMRNAMTSISCVLVEFAVLAGPVVFGLTPLQGYSSMRRGHSKYFQMCASLQYLKTGRLRGTATCSQKRASGLTLRPCTSSIVIGRWTHMLPAASFREYSARLSSASLRLDALESSIVARSLETFRAQSMSGPRPGFPAFSPKSCAMLRSADTQGSRRGGQGRASSRVACLWCYHRVPAPITRR